MQSQIIARIRTGQTYRFHQMRSVKRDGVVVIEDVELDRYRVLGFAFDGVTMQQRVVYVGVEGPDNGRWLVCSLHNFAVRFRLEEPAVECEPTPDLPTEASSPLEWSSGTEAGYVSTGSGA